MFPDPLITPQQQRELEDRVVREVGRRHPEVFAEFFRGLTRQGVGLPPRDECTNATQPLRKSGGKNRLIDRSSIPLAARPGSINCAKSGGAGSLPLPIPKNGTTRETGQK